MTPAFVLFAIVLIIGQLAMPRLYAFLPLVIAGCHLGNKEMIGDLSVSRTLIMLGLLRAYFGGFFVFSLRHPIDRAFVIMSGFLIISSIGHHDLLGSPWIYRAGWVWNILGTYLYARSYLPDLAAFKRFAYSIPLVLIPLSLGMGSEKTTQINAYYLLGASQPYAMIREGKIRAQGPFSHAVLAGCSGATALPFAYLMWVSRRRFWALCGGGACLAVILFSASSGPLAAVAITVAAAALWRFRNHLGALRWFLLIVALAYWVAAGRGPWHIMASLDLVGGSTGWHRAHLIDQAWKYLFEWFLVGTDYTRHWMPTGVSWSPDHSDITNYYIHLGVTAGIAVPTMLVVILWRCFSSLGARMRQYQAEGSPEEMTLWCVGTALAAHAISFVSISYFDQMYVLFYIVVGAVPGLTQPDAATEVSAAEPALGNEPEPVRE
jgi:hypothetical protein